MKSKKRKKDQGRSRKEKTK